MKLKLLGHLGAFEEGVPSHLVNGLVLLPVLVGHDQLQIVPAPGYVEIHQKFALLLFQKLVGLFQNQGVGAGVPHIASNVSFDHAKSNHHLPPFQIGLFVGT
ncbi:hypothetical protein ES703_78782 [subsurface metagenome]